MSNGSLHSTLNDLASAFADSVLAAIRTASLDELGRDTDRGEEGRRSRRGGEQPDPLGTLKTANGRLARRGPEDIAKTLGLVVAALKTSPLRAEEIQKLLKLDKRELPRVLREGLATKKLRKKGQKRSTTYSAR
ncbi:MAG: hypothetical protein ACRELB_12910 [Polyangiaceae bacterium]